MPKRKSNLKGRGIGDTLSKVNNFVRANQLVSKALNEFAGGTGANIASQLGYGKKRRAPRKRVMGGRGFFDVLKNIGGGLGGTVNHTLSGLFGGRKRKILKI